MPSRFLWLAFPFALMVVSVWIVLRGAGASMAPLAILVALCIVGSMRQGWVLRSQGKTTQATVAFAAAIIGLAAAAILLSRAW